jgi:energy-coupling factor transport system permease protein
MNSATSRRLADRIDPRAALAYLGAVLVLAFGLQHPVYLAALTASVWVVLVSLVPSRSYRPYLMYGTFAAVSVMLLNPLISRAGQTIVLTGPTLPMVGRLTISAEAVVFGVGMGLRLLCVVAVFALYSTLVDPDALYRIIAPVSPGSALVTALSIRLFPTTVRDATRIMDAQRSRGLKLDTGSWRSRVAARIPVMDALLVTTLDRAMGVAEALESRGYGRPRRTRLPGARFRRRDALILGLAGGCAAFGLWLALGSARYAYYPVLGDPSRQSDLVLAVSLAVFAAYPAVLDWGWSRWPSSRSTT